MLMVVGCSVAPVLHCNSGNREKNHIGRKRGGNHGAANTDPSHLAGWQDAEYYETSLSFEELFQGHLKNVTSQEGQDHCETETSDHQGRLSPLIKLKLNPRIVN